MAGEYRSMDALILLQIRAPNLSGPGKGGGTFRPMMVELKDVKTGGRPPPPKKKAVGLIIASEKKRKKLVRGTTVCLP